MVEDASGFELCKIVLLCSACLFFRVEGDVVTELQVYINMTKSSL
jgi:hypothetical protein